MNNYNEALYAAKQAFADTKRTIARLDELSELMAQGKFAEADQLMAEIDAVLAKLKAK